MISWFAHPTYASFIDSSAWNDERVIVTRTFSKVYGLGRTEAGVCRGFTEDN